MMEKVNLVVVAHPDDEILGFGATGAKLARQGDRVQAVILCGAAEVRTQRPTDADLAQDTLDANRTVGFETPVLGHFPNLRINNVNHVDLVNFIEEQIRTFQPHRIFTHHPSDLNDDHNCVARACMAACRLFQRVKDVRPLESMHLMEVLSSTEWGFPQGGNGFNPTTYVEIGDFMETKLEALSCYRNVMRTYPHPRSREALCGLAAYRGSQCGKQLAEAFQTVFQSEIGE
jgi:N-acetylglucosamine malate deacetylase 1